MKQQSCKKDVWLSIHSTQQFADCEPEEIVLMTAATLYQRNGKIYIMYEESQITGMEGTRTTLKLDDKQVTMLRSGTLCSELLFAEGQCHVGLYHTGVGAPMTISTRTQQVKNEVTTEGGKLALSYIIEIDNGAVGHHAFDMIVATQPIV